MSRRAFLLFEPSLLSLLVHNARLADSLIELKRDNCELVGGMGGPIAGESDTLNRLNPTA
jgi:hypothetical protein